MEDRALLDNCLRDALDALRADNDNKSDRCQHFYQVVLPMAFEKLMTEKAVRGWNNATQQNVFARTEQFIQFFVRPAALSFALSASCSETVFTRDADAGATAVVHTPG